MWVASLILLLLLLTSRDWKGDLACCSQGGDYTGTDLGVTYSDVDGRVFLGVGNGALCTTLTELFQPGVQIGCETPDLGSLESPVTLSVRVMLESGMASGPGFLVETPSITAVNPAFGPVSGGVLVNMTGSSLAIGNVDNTRVTFNGTDCIIQSTE